MHYECGELEEVIENRVDGVDSVERWNDLRTKAVRIRGRCKVHKNQNWAKVVLGRN